MPVVIELAPPKEGVSVTVVLPMPNVKVPLVCWLSIVRLEDVIALALLYTIPQIPKPPEGTVMLPLQGNGAAPNEVVVAWHPVPGVVELRLLNKPSATPV